MMTVSYGHGIALTPLHVLSAYATIANGGIAVHPRFTPVTTPGQEKGRRVLAEEAADATLEILRAVVADGTAIRADMPDYPIAGKTGTADKARESGRGYHSDRVIASFAGVFPYPDPEYAMIVMLDEPTDPESGIREASRTAVPVYRDAVRRIMPLLGVPPRIRPRAVRKPPVEGMPAPRPDDAGSYEIRPYDTRLRDGGAG